MRNKILTILFLIIICFMTGCDKVPATETPNSSFSPVPPDTNKEVAYLENGIEYVIDGELSCHITGIGKFTGDTLVIPRDDGNGRIVNYIDEYAFLNCTTIKNVTLPDSVKEIKGGAFQNCTSLESINFEEGLNKIGVWSFYNCIALTRISIPASVNVIGQGAFSLCSGIVGFDINQANEAYTSVNGVVYNKDKTNLLIYPIGNTATEFSVPEGVIKINNASFSECQYIVKVTLSSTVENVGDHAFRRCPKLETVTLSENLKRLGVGSFYECKALKTVNYPGSKEKWEDDEQLDLAKTWDKGTGSLNIVYDYKG